MENFILSLGGAIVFGIMFRSIIVRNNLLTSTRLVRIFSGVIVLFSFVFFFVALNSTSSSNETKHSVASLSEIVACEKETSVNKEVCGIDKNGNKIRFCPFHASVLSQLPPPNAVGV